MLSLESSIKGTRSGSRPTTETERDGRKQLDENGAGSIGHRVLTRFRRGIGKKDRTSGMRERDSREARVEVYRARCPIKC